MRMGGIDAQCGVACGGILLPQGAYISLVLYNYFKFPYTWTLLCVDDVLLLKEICQDLEQQVEKWKMWPEEYDMWLNTKKMGVHGMGVHGMPTEKWHYRHQWSGIDQLHPV